MKSPTNLHLQVRSGLFATCKLPETDQIPKWVSGEPFWFSKTPGETTVVCLQDLVPDTVQAEMDWRCFCVVGTLDFSETGIIAGISSCLANVQVSVFTLSTFNTDYFLVKQIALNEAIEALQSQGYRVNTQLV